MTKRVLQKQIKKATNNKVAGQNKRGFKKKFGPKITILVFLPSLI